MSDAERITAILYDLSAEACRLATASNDAGNPDRADAWLEVADGIDRALDALSDVERIQ